MKSPIRILLYFAVWGRHDVLRVCLEGVKRLCAYSPDRFTIIPFAVCSNPEDAAVLDQYNIDHCSYPNDKLGEKKNYGLSQALSKYEFDYMLEIGSDDIISNDLLDLYEPHMRLGALLLSVNTCFFIEIATSRVARWSSDLIIGAGRAIHVSILKSMLKVEFRFTQSIGGINFDYRAKQVIMLAANSADTYEACQLGVKTGNLRFYLWDDHINRGLDTNSHQRILRETNAYDTQLYIEEPLVIDLKSGENINSFDRFDSYNLPASEVLKYFSKKETDMIISLNKPISNKQNRKKKAAC